MQLLPPSISDRWPSSRRGKPVINCVSVLLLAALTGGGQAGELRARVLDQGGHDVEDAVVLAKPISRAVSPPVPRRDGLVDQIDREFAPLVTIVNAGTQVRFPNHDNIRHEVYSFSSAKTFELPLYSGTTAPPVVFDKPGVVILGCNIHDWMVAYVYVADTAYFAKTGKGGIAAIVDLPAGDYDVRVWQPRMNGSEQSTIRHIAVASAGMTEAEWKLTLKPALRIRRAPVSLDGRYR
jgi:plastocyanin